MNSFYLLCNDKKNNKVAFGLIIDEEEKKAFQRSFQH